ncbi:MAG: aldehyde dehydrogenase family protein, partial [Bacteroidia bacterium]|nr:aldehyde dehydrogenase family protein [Bacteroidia bacterium]MDW8334528.1 aldehyde dehydrogenase family protein [Bacteroidia bacterium]
MKGFTQLEVSSLFSKHKERIERALTAYERREFYAAFPEMPGDASYPADGEKTARERFAALMGKPYDELLQRSDGRLTSAEVSPYTMQALKIAYPSFNDPNEYVETAERAARLLWINSTPESRVGTLAEALERIKDAFFDIAVATQHTTGQAFMMAFQASGPHAADRAMEALALSYREQTRFPSKVRWEKPMGKTTAVVEKYFRPMPRGVAVAIGCSTFPVWNSLPGIFASLAAGNPVVVKPHPGSILPLAVCVAKIQQVLKEQGYEPEVCLLAPDLPNAPIARALCENQRVKIIDFTGGNEFGRYVESLVGKITFTEKAGANSIVIDSTSDLKLMAQNIA